MNSIVKSAEGIVSPKVLGIAAGIGVAYMLWPRVGSWVAGKLPSSMGPQATTALVNGAGAVGALALKGMLPANWRIASDAMAGTLVYGTVESFLPQSNAALPA